MRRHEGHRALWKWNTFSSFVIHYITDLSPQLRSLARDEPKNRIATQLEGPVLNNTARVAQGMGVNGFAVKWIMCTIAASDADIMNCPVEGPRKIDIP